MTYFFIFLFLIASFIIIFFRLYLFLFPQNRLTILMYHSVKPTSANELIVTTKNFEEQLKYLKENNYNPLFFRNLSKFSTKKNIILTFDDGYKDNEEFALPLLKKYGQKATIFLPTSRINHDSDKMTFEELRNLDKNIIELALHSHNHNNFNELTISEIEKDLMKNMDVLEKEKVSFTKVLAYPYGRYPKGNQNFFKVLEKLHIDFAVRVGNKINYFPTKKPYELCRISVDGSDSLAMFKLKLIFGKLKF